MSGNVHWVDWAWQVRGQRAPKLVGRTSFKWPNLLSMHFAGKGDDYPRGALYVAEEWVAHNQRLFNRADVVLRVFGQTSEGALGSWPVIPAGSGMFGSPPNDQGNIDVDYYLQLCRTGGRVEWLTELNKNVLDKMFEVSERTGCIFEYVANATVKQLTGICRGVVDHHVRQVAEECRALQEKYPRAVVVYSMCNEWNVLNAAGITLSDVNLWATRFYRWVHESELGPDGKPKKLIAFEAGRGWYPEQWPEGFAIVDGGGSDSFDYECGTEAGKFQMGAVHLARRGGPFVGRDDWTEITPELMDQLRTNARGAPVGSTESMYLVSKPGTEHWYRNRNGYNTDVPVQIQFVSDMREAFDYTIVHDDIGAQTDTAFNPESQWESALAELFGGSGGGGTPPPPGVDPLAEVRPAVRRAYLAVLGRDPWPADRDSLEHYNTLLRVGELDYEGLLFELAQSKESKEKLGR